MSTAPSIQVLVDDHEEAFERPEITVGRSADNDVVVGANDQRVSRRHATIRWDGSSWWWVDESTRGSFVEGAAQTRFRIAARTQVALGASDGPTATVIPPTSHEDAGDAALHVEAAGQAVVVTAADGPVRVGRSDGNTIVVRDDNVSREHLVIGHEGGRWTVTDRSSNGTFVDGHRIGEVTEVDRSLELRLGQPDGVALRLRLDDDRRPSDRFPNDLGRLPRHTPGPGSPSVPGSLVLSRPVLGTLRIGRAADNDVVIADDLTVSRHHAELRTLSDGSLLLVDLGSRTGTFLDGQRVDRAAVTQGALVGVGRHLFVLRDGMLDEYVDDGVQLDVRDLSVSVPGRRLLHDVSFAVEPGQLVAVVGPSGAGKTTLLRSLTGMEPQAGAAVHYNGRELRASMEELRYRIGYVPQDDILHTTLKLRNALEYAADLRFASDVSREERNTRVSEVLLELGLEERADLQISRLSGGQRKRASVALELLTKPALLFLDEPTSGLDPGFERSVMELLRELADAGHTVIVITHAVASLELCDRVLFLASGGHLAFYGPASEALAHFEADDYADVFVRLAGEEDWEERLRRTGAWDRWIARPPLVEVPSGPRPGTPRAAPRRAGWVRQLGTLSRRAVAVLASTRGHAALLVAQAPTIAVLLLISVGTDNLSGTSGTPRALLAILVLASAAMGLVNSCREIVRESAIYQRERTVGLSLSAYLMSKFLCLGVLAAIQALVVSVLVLGAQGGPPDGALTGSGALDLALFVFATALSTVAMGLAVSALVQTDSAALVMIPVLIVAQLVLSNAFLDVEEAPGLTQAAWTAPGYWGMRGMASSSDLLRLEAREVEGELVSTCLLKGRDDLPESTVKTFLGDAPCPVTWGSTRTNVLAAVAGLVGLVVGYGLVAAAALRRRDPLR